MDKRESFVINNLTSAARHFSRETLGFASVGSSPAVAFSDKVRRNVVNTASLRDTAPD
jgi:hypothetical protein